MNDLSVDFETRSTSDLQAVGVYKYVEDPNTDIWCMSWAIGDAEPRTWFAGSPPPPEIVEHVKSGGALRGWNSLQFERIVWRAILTPRYGFPEPAMAQWYDTATEAAAMALPRGLENCAKVVGVAEQKDTDGHRAMLRMSRPRQPRKGERTDVLLWHDGLDDLINLALYCEQDVRTERAVANVLRRLSSHEREILLHDQVTNDRGIAFDRPLAEAAQAMTDLALEQANQVIKVASGGVIESVTKRGAIVRYLQDAGHDVASIAKANVVELLQGELAPKVREVVEARAEGGRTSVAKIKKMFEMVCADGCFRGMEMYHGASTGRSSGKGIQVHNFPKGEIPDVESYITRILAGEFDSIDLEHPVLSVISSLLRGLLVARRGCRLVVGDFSAIEARVLNWLAGQDDMLELFRKYDAAPAGDKPRFDPYRHNAARLYHIPLEDVQKLPHRHTGKFQELGCGYQMGGVKAYTAAKEIYGLDMAALKGSEAAGKAFAKEVVESYRASHPYVVDLWSHMNVAALTAIEQPGTVVPVGAGKVKFTRRGGYLWMLLPSGRPLAYPKPEIVDKPVPWGGTKPTVQFQGIDSYTHQWGYQHTYGGKLVENAVQAISRDLMMDARLRVEAAGYPVILSCHDEIVVDCPNEYGSTEEFQALMSELPSWAGGCPVAVEAWSGTRYAK